MPTLLYSGDCPYCRAVSRVLKAIDFRGHIDHEPIESAKAGEMVKNHHGEYVHAPHLFTDDLVYYGITPTAVGVAKELAKRYVPFYG